MPSARQIVQSSPVIQLPPSNGAADAFRRRFVAESAQSVHAAYSSDLTVSSSRRAQSVRARERPPLEKVGLDPPDGADNDQSEGFEYRCSNGPGFADGSADRKLRPSPSRRRRRACERWW